MSFGASFTPLLPWTFDAPPQPNLTTTLWNVGGNNTGPVVYGTQPEARKWILSRQATLLGDDGGSKNFFNTDNSFGPNAAAALWRNPSAPASAQDEAPYTGYTPTASIQPDPWLVSGRVDIAGSNLDDVKRVVTLGSNGLRLPWITTGADGQWQRIRNMTYGPPVGGNALLGGLQAWPRSEKIAPSMSRIDEILSSTVLAGNCSSIEIDWTWANDTGRSTGTGNSLARAVVLGSGGASVGLAGVNIDPRAGTVWFGLPDGLMPPSQWRGVTSLAGPQGNQAPSANYNLSSSAGSDFGLAASIGTNVFQSGNNSWVPFDNAVRVAAPVLPANIEGLQGITRPLGNSMPVWVYTAVFGFNRTQAFDRSIDGTAYLRDDVTPWPRSLRFTLRLHDPRLAIEAGRTFQFVVDLPPQTQE